MTENIKDDLSEVKEIVKKSALAIEKINSKLEVVSEQVARNTEGINALLSGIKVLQTDLTRLIDEHQFSTQEQINEIEDKGVGDNKAHIDYNSKRIEALEKTFTKHGMEVEALDIAID